MKIKIERSGGVSGISTYKEIDAKDLPSSIIKKVNKIAKGDNSLSLRLKSSPKGSADYYSYKISIIDGSKQKVVECNEFTINDDLKSIIKYVQSQRGN